MTTPTNRRTLRRAASLAVAGALVLGAAGRASADDAGVHDFFSAIFGGGPAPASAPADVPAPLAVMPYRPRVRTLTVRLHKPKPRLVIAQERPSKPVGKVSIYEDKTLRRGDAVMTAQGIRVFAGSASWPYRPADFVVLADASNLSKDQTKVLAELDRAPRG